MKGHHNRLSGILFSSEVNDAFNWSTQGSLFLEHLFEETQIKDVSFSNMDALLLVRIKNFEKPIDNVLLAVRIVIDYDNFGFLLVQNLYDGVASDVAQPSR